MLNIINICFGLALIVKSQNDYSWGFQLVSVMAEIGHEYTFPQGTDQTSRFNTSSIALCFNLVWFVIFVVFQGFKRSSELDLFLHLALYTLSAILVSYSGILLVGLWLYNSLGKGFLVLLSTVMSSPT
jgi:hypothetical protein